MPSTLWKRNGYQPGGRCQRILSGLAEARRRGKQLGRPKGSVKQQEQLLSEYAGVVNDLKAGLSIRQIAAIRQVSTDTVQRVKKAMPSQTTISDPLL